MPSASFEPDPTETYIRFPSGEKAMSRVQWPAPLSTSCETIVCGGPPAFRSPFL